MLITITTEYISKATKVETKWLPKSLLCLTNITLIVPEAEMEGIVCAIVKHDKEMEH